MAYGDRQTIIQALGKVSSDRYTAGFISTVNQLSQGMDAQRSHIIQALGTVSPDRYTAGFIRAVNFMRTLNQLSHESEGEDYKSKLSAIRELGNLSLEHYTFYIKCALNSTG
jgi:hypothetical protein